MREMKFRAWNKYGMSDPFTLKSISEYDSSVNGNGKIFWPQPTEFMQYTGLKDKNGKEIYEGDLLTSPHYPESGCVSEIRWNNNMCRFQKISRWKTNRGFEAVDECSNVSISQYQIIGNIHENLNLLL